MRIALILLAAVGHASLWVAVINRLHATSIAGRVRKLMTLACFAGLFSVPLACGIFFLREGLPAFRPGGASPLLLAGLGYSALCWLALALAAAGWVRRHLLRRPPHGLRDHRTRVFRPGKGDRHLLCEAPEGPFRQKVPVPFSRWKNPPLSRKRPAIRGPGSGWRQPRRWCWRQWRWSPSASFGTRPGCGKADG